MFPFVLTQPTTTQAYAVVVMDRVQASVAWAVEADPLTGPLLNAGLFGIAVLAVAWSFKTGLFRLRSEVENILAAHAKEREGWGQEREGYIARLQTQDERIDTLIASNDKMMTTLADATLTGLRSNTEVLRELPHTPIDPQTEALHAELRVIIQEMKGMKGHGRD